VVTNTITNAITTVVQNAVTNAFTNTATNIVTNAVTNAVTYTHQVNVLASSTAYGIEHGLFLGVGLRKGRVVR
jgi:hypothetical protein